MVLFWKASANPAIDLTFLPSCENLTHPQRLSQCYLFFPNKILFFKKATKAFVRMFRLFLDAAIARKQLAHDVIQEKKSPGLQFVRKR